MSKWLWTLRLLPTGRGETRGNGEGLNQVPVLVSQWMFLDGDGAAWHGWQLLAMGGGLSWVRTSN